MGIKTKFNPMGGGQSDKGKLSDWRYTNLSNGSTLLYEYVGGDWANTVYVPKVKGNAVINNYTSGTTTTASNTPFFNNPNVISVDLQKVPFVNNNMYNAFYNCRNLVSVNNINSNVTNMAWTFYYCNNLNQNIQIPNSVTDMYDTFRYCYNLNQNIQIPNSVTNMASTFEGCFNLNQNIQIGNSVTNMASTFYYCTNLNQNIQIPNSVTTMAGTFSHCNNLNQSIQIPNSVTNMASTFYFCYNLNQNIQIPNSVTNMYSTFAYCNNLNQSIQIPNSVTNMASTFFYCTNLNQNIQIPNSVTNMASTFLYCTNLNQNVQIGNSVTDMSNTFRNCVNFQSNVFILSANISNAYNCFYASGLTKNVIFPLRYINNVNTLTRNTLVTAATGGYAVGTCVGNLVNNAAQNAVFYAYDPVAWEGYNTWTGNGTHWILNKWAGIGKNPGATTITVPNSITSYATYPTAINISTYTGNTVINSIKVTKDVPWVSNQTGWYKNSKSRGGAFKGCTGLTHANVYINDSVIGMHETFMSCTNLRTADVHLSNAGTSTFCFFYHCDSLVNTYSSDKQSTLVTEGLVKPEHIASNLNVASVHIPSTVTNVESMYGNCQSLDTVLLDGEGITSIAYLREGCNSRNENIYIKSPLVTAITNWHRGYNASYRRNYYIPYMYANGTYTATHATLYAQTLMRNNATTNFYMYDISPYNSVADYVVTFTSPNLYLNTYRGMSHTPTTVNKSPFGGTVYMTSTTYALNASITSLDCNDVPFATTPASAFRNCYNLTSIKNLNVPSSMVANHQSMFENCSSLRHSVYHVPDGATQAAYMYKGCTNLGLDGSETIVFGRNVVNFRQTFYGCSNFQGDIYFMCPTGSTSANKWNSTFTGYNASRSKNLWCYFTYSNGVNTSMYNLLKGTALFNNNSTSNFYIKNIGTQPLTNNYNFAYNKLYSEIRFIGSSVGSTLVVPSKLAVEGSYADSTTTTEKSITSLANVFRNTALNRPVQIPNSVPSLYDAFNGCHNLNQNIQIPCSVADMYGTFSECYKLNQNIQIPNSVTNMAWTFYFCFNLNQNIQIPNSVTNMANTFYFCYNLNQNIQIPNSVTNMAWTFAYCNNLNQNIQIPNSVTNMAWTFAYCDNLNQNVQIGNSVTNMASTFYYCTNLNQNIQIPNSVTNMSDTFSRCNNLSSRINILSQNITNADYCFYSTSLPKDVYIPYKYSNGVNSATFNSFVSAGYLYANGTSTGQSGVTMHDWTPPVTYAGCVLYNTSILMADKTTKEAQEVKLGDIVQTYNEDKEEFEPNKVLAVHKNRKDDIIKVTFEDDSYVELTSGHPFLTEKGWASYDNDKTRKENLYNGAELYQLEVGDKCMTQDGTFIKVTSIEVEDLGIVDVYDFTIENAHTFMGGGLSLAQRCHSRILVLHNSISVND